MSVNTELAALRRKMVNCDVLAFVDLTTATTLMYDSRITIEHELLEGLAATARDLFQGETAARAAGVMGENTPDLLNKIVLVEDLEANIFLRSDAVPEGVICCVCTQPFDISDTFAQAKSAAALLNDTNDVRL